ncbi:MAG TPA: hypothetical protein VKA68_03905 [bacterium]|nr:hypothetical protein [bacterium]
MVEKFYQDDILYAVLENDCIRIMLVPEFGGKMVELRNKITDTQFLLPMQEKFYSKKVPSYGAKYDQFQPSGFDEFFPTMRACSLDDTHFPDHGEVWSLPWDLYTTQDALYLSIRGVKTEYRLFKKIQLAENQISINYTLANLSDESLYYLWTANPLLNPVSGARIVIEPSITEVHLDWISDHSLGNPGEEVSWPRVLGSDRDFSIVQDPGPEVAFQVYTPKIRRGFFGMYYQQSDEALLFRVDPDEVPYMGLWISYEGWSANGGDQSGSIALQPTNGWPGALDDAVEYGDCEKVEGKEVKEWTFSIDVQHEVSLDIEHKFAYNQLEEACMR